MFYLQISFVIGPSTYVYQSSLEYGTGLIYYYQDMTTLIFTSRNGPKKAN